MPWLPTSRGDLHYEIDTPTLPWAREPGTVVFCHGVGTNCDIWAGWLPALRQRLRVVRFDTRGFGRSAAAAAGVPWSLDRLADDILAVADMAGAERFHLVGESLGGTVSLYLATRDSGRLRSLTVASTAHHGQYIGAVRDWWADIEGSGTGPWSRKMMAQRFVESGLSQEAWDWFEGVQRESPPSSLLGAAQLLLDTNLSEVLAEVIVPVLIINSDGSPYVTPKLAVDLHSRLANAELCVLPNSRHGIVFSHADECARLLLDFISRRAG